MNLNAKTFWTLLLLIAALIFVANVHAQEPTGDPIVSPSITNAPEPVQRVLAFLAQGSNWIVAPYGIYDMTTKSAGGGVALAYKVSDFVLPTLRLDYINGDVFMPSGTVQLQMPIKVTTNIWLTPFLFGGVATAVTGSGADGTAIGIFGLGGDIRITEHFGILGDWEKWSSHEQLRFGFHWKF